MEIPNIDDSAKQIVCKNNHGLTTQNYYYLKCWFVLNYDGKEVFKQIFDWGFKSIVEIKEALFNLPNYSGVKYRKDFNASQRIKIEEGNVDKFDLGLLYLLLQRVCSLPLPSDKEWGKNGDPNTLPNILYQLKMKRNTLAHTDVNISESEMLAEIEELKTFFNTGLKLAAAEFNIPNESLLEVTERINNHILSVQNSNETSIAEIIKEIAQTEDDLNLSESEIKLFKIFKPFFKNIFSAGKAATEVKDVSDPVIKEIECIAKKIKSENISVDEREKVVKEVKELVRNVEPVFKEEIRPAVRKTLKEIGRIFRF